MSKFKDLTGMTFGKLTVVSFAGIPAGKGSTWLCQCECGNTTVVSGGNLSAGQTKSCGCLKKGSKKREKSSALLDLTGMTFGRLSVLRKSAGRKEDGVHWDCRCSCGKEVSVPSPSLRFGRIRHCGCMPNKGNTRHMKSRTPTHNAWCKMKERCLNNKSKDYASYGGRGIKICNRWLHSFENFYEDMGECLPKLTLDRLDVNGDYEPGNCRWATQKQQARNRRSTLFATVAGKEGKLIDIAESFGISIVGIRCYYNRHGITDMTDYLRDRLGHLYDPGLKKWLEFSEAA